MSIKVNYFKIGLFTITAIVLLLIAVLVFGSGLFAEKNLYFETYFDDTVTGLTVGAPVEMRGVQIGRVEKITFAQSEYNLEVGSEDFYNYGSYVMVLGSLEVEYLPSELTSEEMSDIYQQLNSRGFRLRLTSNILTGQAFLQGDYLDPERYPVIEVPWKPRNIYISSAPGEFTTIKESIDGILTKLEQVDTANIGQLIEQILTSLNQILVDSNITELSDGLQNFIANADQVINDARVQEISSNIQNLLDKASQTIDEAEIPELSNQLQILIAHANQAVNDANIPNVSDNVRTLIANTNQAINDANVPVFSNELITMLAEAKQTNQYLQELLKRPEETQSQMANIAVMISNLNSTLMQINQLIKTQSPQIEQTLNNLRLASTSLSELINDLKQNPSELIFSDPPTKSEVLK